MTHMKLMASGGSGTWSVTLTDAKTKAPAGQFVIDAAYGSATARFVQGVAKATGTDLLFFTAQRGTEQFPLKFPCVNMPTYDGSSGALNAFAQMEAMYNDFLDNDWEPVFETFDGRNRWTIEVSEVRSARQRPPQEDTHTISAPSSKNRERPAFRASF